MSFSINFANNLIEKSPTSAAAVIIDPTIVFLDGEDHLRPPKNIERWRMGGDQPQYLVGEPDEVSYFEW